MKKILLIFTFFYLLNAQDKITQAPLIVEFPVFKEAEKLCNGSDYTKIACLVEILKNYNNRIYTKVSGQNGKINVLFYALDANGRITYPQNINSKYCEFIDTFGRKSVSKLSGNGFSYVLNYNFAYSSSFNKAYVSCHFMQNNTIVSQTTQPITVVPNDFDINLTIKTAQDSIFSLNTQGIPSSNISQLSTQNNVDLILKSQTYPININANATARTINGEIDEGFSDVLLPLSIRFNRDNGLCNPIGESINGSFVFKNGRYIQNNINIDFLDVASGELEIILGHRLDSDDRMSGKCLSEIPRDINIANVGKIPCQKPIIIKKRVEILPYSFFIDYENIGKQLYYNQHTFIPAIPFLPTARLSINAINDKNELLRNFTKDCFARDISLKLEDNKNNFLLISENIPDSIIPKDTFVENSQSRVVRRLSSSGIKDRNLTPLDVFHSNIINLNDTYFRIEFYNENEKYPVYFIKPKIRSDWRIALMRGRISLVENANKNTALVANPKIQYEFFCKSPVCKVVDFESVLSPNSRFPKSQTQDWYINTAHPSNLKVLENNLILPENISIYSIGNIVYGVQTLALQSSIPGDFNVKVRQGSGYDDFALFLYFSPSYINIRENLGVETKVHFSYGEE
ncbi:hypothetical protein CCY99_05105 [Helicobacter sp. 16-1353]|uniref:hypothetical protein n=1 Tax=Helicobacter sp. 16-1353 TaxID=2004996 RepID=UPI000DCD4FCE|nr:hypothetical protein [Helicobacter sp. 16-1353]RAX54060.1 hypothetical protein CCY99_05105 [Helicobacter sp. 16-1353]